ncbi:MAG TPA: response regulator [Cyclobacteriaceae bacterium]|nr:response regulator [Cyclobacteriaceae bacterium]
MSSISTIFIIDDDPVFQAILNMSLSQIDHPKDVKMFSNGKDAITALHGRACCHRILVFLDLHMPIMDGWEFLSQLQQHPFCKDVRVIITSSSTLKEDKVRAQQFPQVWSFQEKPLNLSLIKEMVGEHFKY